jgi:hypothetical protein
MTHSNQMLAGAAGRDLAPPWWKAEVLCPSTTVDTAHRSLRDDVEKCRLWVAPGEGRLDDRTAPPFCGMYR